MAVGSGGANLHKQPSQAPPPAHPAAVEGEPRALAGGPADEGRQVVVVGRLVQRDDQVLR